MSAIRTKRDGRGSRRWTPALAALALACSFAAFAQQVVSVPEAHLEHIEGTVAFAPQGEKEWQDVQPRRVLRRGDRLWTDHGSRAEVQAGGHALRLDGQSQLVLENVSETATQLSLTQGSLIATVTRVNPGDTFEIGTPNLAFRARQPGDYRIDVDAQKGTTRVTVASGSGVVYGEKGEALELRSGQRFAFHDRNLSRMLQPAFATVDDFERWANARKHGEPTVSMPVVAAAPSAPPVQDLGRTRTIVIAGSAASLKQGAAPAQAAAKPVARTAAPVAPAIAQQVAIAPPARASVPLAAAPMKITQVLPQRAPAAPAPQAQAPVKAAAAVQAAPAPQASANAQAAAQAAQAGAAVRAEQDRRAAAAEAKRAEERRRAVAAKRADEERRHAQAKREAEHKRVLAKRAEEEKRAKLARHVIEEKRLAAARKAEAQKVAELRQKQIARLQEQARRDEQSVQARRAETARRADEDRREEQARRDEQARREEQVRRDQQRRDEEMWLRQTQQVQQPQLLQPARPQPMGVPVRRIS